MGCASHPIWTWKSQGQKIWLKSAWWSGRIHTRGKHQSIIFTNQNGLIGFNIFLGGCFKDLLFFYPWGKWTNLTNMIFFQNGYQMAWNHQVSVPFSPWYSRFALLQAIRPYARLSLTRHGMNSPALQWDGPSHLQCLGSWWVDIPQKFFGIQKLGGWIRTLCQTNIFFAPENGSNGWL